MKRKSKYNAVRTTVDNHVFHSKKEAKRYAELKLLQQAGEISNLVMQPPYPLKVGGYVVATYRADFRYTDNRRAAEVVEDCKGFRTEEYKIKKKLMLAIYKIEIFET